MVHVRELTPEFRAKHGPETPSFNHSGLLWMNAFLLYDRRTESLWHHYTGQAMSGPLRGAQLRQIPSWTTTFKAWREEHPDTVVLVKTAEAPPVDVYARRNRQLTFGFGIEGGGASRLLPWETLAAGPVETEVGGIPVVVVRVDGRSASAFDRRVRGRTLSFVEDMRDGRPQLVERTDDGRPGRRWSARSGRAAESSGSEGASAESLRHVHASLWETQAWTLQHPGSPIGAR